MSRLPHKAYSAMERWLIKNKWILLVVAYLAIFFVWPLFDRPEMLDIQLLEGIGE